MSPNITLRILQGTNQGRVLSLSESGRVVVGRARDCAIQIPPWPENADISRRHCEFEIDFPTIKVRDLGSMFGTFVNGELIGKRFSPRKSDTDLPHQPAIELKDGDKVQVGNNVFRVEIYVAEEALVSSR